MASPSPTTPPAQQTGHGHSYFTRMADAGRRRDSLTQALKDSFMLDSGNNRKSDEDRNGATQSVDPIKRVVTRRGSLLVSTKYTIVYFITITNNPVTWQPKTKNFQRIKAALQEETSIVDMEVKREAEITRQLREEDEGAMTTNALPAEAQRSVESPIEDEAMDDTQSTITPPVGSASRPKDLGLSFSQQAQLNGFFSFDSLESVSGSPPRFPPTRKNSDGDVIVRHQLL